MAQYKAIYAQTDDGWWLGFCPDIPGVNAQELTFEEVQEALADGIRLMLEIQRERLQTQISEWGHVKTQVGTIEVAS